MKYSSFLPQSDSLPNKTYHNPYMYSLSYSKGDNLRRHSEGPSQKHNSRNANSNDAKFGDNMKNNWRKSALELQPSFPKSRAS